MYAELTKWQAKNGRWELIEMNGCFNGCWHDHCTASGILGKDNLHSHTYTKNHYHWGTTLCHFTYMQMFHSNHMFGKKSGAWIIQQSKCMNLFEICLHSRTRLFVLLLSVHHHNQQPFSPFDCFLRYSHKWNSALYRTSKVLHAGFHPSVRSLPFGLVVQ